MISEGIFKLVPCSQKEPMSPNFLHFSVKSWGMIRLLLFLNVTELKIHSEIIPPLQHGFTNSEFRFFMNLWPSRIRVDLFFLSTAPILLVAKVKKKTMILRFLKFTKFRNCLKSFSAKIHYETLIKLSSSRHSFTNIQVFCLRLIFPLISILNIYKIRKIVNSWK